MQRNRELSLAYGLEELTLIKVLPKAEICTFNDVLIKVSLDLFKETEQTSMKFIWNHNESKQSTLDKCEREWRHQAPRPQIILESYSNKNTMVLE